MSDREEDIRRRAYEIWEREGRPHGKDLEHWLKAFKEFGSKKQLASSAQGTKTVSGRKAKAPNAAPDVNETAKTPKKPAKRSMATAATAGEVTKPGPRSKNVTTH